MHTTQIAKSQYDAVYPNLQRGLVHAFVPSIARRGLKRITDYKYGTTWDLPSTSTWVESSPKGYVVSFPGSVYATIPKTVSLGEVHTIIVTMWNNSNLKNTESAYLLGDPSLSIGFGPRSDDGAFYKTTASTSLNTIGITEATWRQIAVVRYPGFIDWYTEGVIEAAGISMSGSFSFNSMPTATGAAYIGYVDEIYAWDRTLSANEIALIYRNPYAPLLKRKYRVAGVSVPPAVSGFALPPNSLSLTGVGR